LNNEETEERKEVIEESIENSKVNEPLVEDEVLLA